MNKARADEIIRNTFYRHIDNLAGALSRICDNTEVAFDVGRYVGMMQKDLENELEKEVAEEYKGGWIPCSERLPEVPKGIDDEECPEFNVTINGAEVATTLKHSWDGKWFDDHGNLYDVIAWQPLPESYNPKGDN